MVTGCDQVLISSGPIDLKISRFIDAWSVRWPMMTVEIDGAGPPRRWSGDRAADLGESAAIYLVRDPEMDDHWEAHGYALDMNSEAPLCVMYQRFRASTASFTAMEDPYARGSGFSPYDVTVISDGLYLTTIVTPDRESDFSRLAVNLLVGALSSSDLDPSMERR